jgi:hypothetical protein
MRLKAEIWIKAYIRRCAAEGAAAVVVRHGDDDAGAIFVRVNRLDGTSLLFGPAPAGFSEAARERQWVACLDGSSVADEKIESYLARETEFDPDLWIVEVEDRAGRHFLDGWLAAARA